MLRMITKRTIAIIVVLGLTSVVWASVTHRIHFFNAKSGAITPIDITVANKTSDRKIVGYGYDGCAPITPKDHLDVFGSFDNIPSGKSGKFTLDVARPDSCNNNPVQFSLSDMQNSGGASSPAGSINIEGITVDAQNRTTFTNVTSQSSNITVSKNGANSITVTVNKG